MTVILYLDIDGVLHSDISQMDENGNIINDLFSYADHLIEILNKFPELKIVVHSAWRYIYGPTSTIWKLPKQIRERVLRTTNPSNQNRWDSIVEDIKKHNVTHFVGVDDFINSFPKDCPQMVFTDPISGLSIPEVKQELETKIRQLYQDISENKLK